MNSNKKTYTAADFADYYAGIMPAKQMHALEKEALTDPFLADALEGYVLTQTATADVKELEIRLFRKEKKEGIIIKKTMGFWLRISALLLFVGTAGYFFYWMYDTQQPINVAETKTTTQSNIDTNKNTSLNPEVPKDTLVNTINGTLAQQEKSTQFADNSLSTTAPAAPSTEVQKDLYTRNELKSVTQKEIVAYNKDQYKKYFSQSGQVQDTTGAPVAFATIKDKNTKSATITDELGRFKLKTADSSAIVSVSSVGYAAKEIVLEKNTPQSITLDNKQAELSEVVVVGYGTKRQQKSMAGATTTISRKELEKKDVANGLQGKVAGVEIKKQNASESSVKNKTYKPVSAKTDTVFNDYVKNNIIPLFDENNNPYKGKIELSFDTDKDGRPTNIQIISSSCTSCNNQAINLLKNGPVWLSDNSQSKKVIIEF